MLINLTDVLTSEGKMEKMQVPIEMTSFSNGLSEYRIVEKSPLDFTFTRIERGKAEIHGKASLVLQMECDRCLKEVKKKMELDFLGKCLHRIKRRNIQRKKMTRFLWKVIS